MMGSEDAGSSAAVAADGEERPPPLPPRPSLQPTPKDRAPLQSKPTTALSSMTIQTLSFPDGSRGTFSTTADSPAAEEGTSSPAETHDLSGIGFHSIGSARKQDTDESMSIMSMAPHAAPTRRS
ncbi:hypothetical protein CIB48_g10111 [Xylaria polymorpha]|nr:hypothetical protein CIB48_g10111 [Xylaria polymorpha]